MSNATEIRGNIFNVQHFSTQDGPGIRTTIFFKGCPLGCLWCSNPESQKTSIEIAHRDSLCFACGDCVEICKQDAITLTTDENNKQKIQIDREKCTDCGECIDVCTAGALQRYGRFMSLGEVFEEVKKDELYYSNSDGGVTASGGEPLGQAEFVYHLFRRLRSIGIHTTLDTSGYASTDTLKRVLSETDLVLYDLKIMNGSHHRQYIKVENEGILRNAETASATGTPMIIRIPFILQINEWKDWEANLIETARFVSKLNQKLHVDLLPFHRMGENKYKMLDRQCHLNAVSPPTEEQQQKAIAIFNQHGLDCAIQR
jgi:pyruvate formate lyase activating enzyme